MSMTAVCDPERRCRWGDCHAPAAEGGKLCGDHDDLSRKMPRRLSSVAEEERRRPRRGRR